MLVNVRVNQNHIWDHNVSCPDGLSGYFLYISFLCALSVASQIFCALHRYLQQRTSSISALVCVIYNIFLNNDITIFFLTLLYIIKYFPVQWFYIFLNWLHNISLREMYLYYDQIIVNNKRKLYVKFISERENSYKHLIKKTLQYFRPYFIRYLYKSRVFILLGKS